MKNNVLQAGDLLPPLRLFAGGLLENLSRCGFIGMLVSCKPADLYLQYLHVFWKKSKCPLNWAGGQHNLPILFVTMRLMVGLALNLLVTSFTWGCLFSADNNNGSVFTVAVLGAWLLWGGSMGWSCLALEIDYGEC